MSYKLDNLTQEDKEKLARILSMIQSHESNVFEEEVTDLDERIAFIRRHGKNKAAFYSEAWYHANPKRTAAIYYKVREGYVREYRFSNVKIKRAKESMKRMLDSTNLVTH